MQRMQIVLFGSVAALGLLLSVQGWRGRLNGFNYDQLVNTDQALALVHGGHLPQCGGLCSFGSHIPPGTSWLLVPGVLTGEPRLYELVGPLLLLGVTAVGLYMLVRRVTDGPTAAFAVAVYAISALGISYSSSLWPRAHPAAYVWMAYFTLLWIQRRGAWYLAAALVVFAAGILIYLEMAPAIVMLPLAWLVYRPPLRATPVLIGLTVGAAVWLPYLSFERQRDFVDLQSQLFMRPLHPDQPARLAAFGTDLERWDEATNQLVPYTAPRRTALPASGAGKIARSTVLRIAGFARNLCANFVYEDWAGVVPALIFLTFFIAAASGYFELPAILTRASWLIWCGLGLIVVAAVGNPAVARAVSGQPLTTTARNIVLAVEALAVIGGLTLCFRRPAARLLLWLQNVFPPAPDGSGAVAGAKTMLVLLAGPWLALAFLAQSSKYQWGLWPLQIAVLGGALFALARGARGKLAAFAWVAWLSLGCLACNGVVFQRVSDWAATGFSGRDRDEIRMADFLAEQIQDDPSADRSQPASIGYHVFFNGFEATSLDLDSHYYLGAPIDRYLADRYIIATKPLPAQGYTSGDEYRVVEVAPRQHKPLRFRFAGREQFELLKQFGNLQVWKRKQAASVPLQRQEPTA